MIDIFIQHQNGIYKALLETTFMVFASTLITTSIAIPLGILLYSLRKDFLLNKKIPYEILSFTLNSLRSVPFLIFIFILIPLNRFLFKTAFGNIATLLPISLVSISIYSRFVEQALLNVNQGIINRAISMGANKFQIIRYFLIPSIKNDLILSLTSTIISMLSYSTVMGVIGAGGLGSYAFRYGYQEYNYQLMYIIIIIFMFYVLLIQSIGYALIKRKGKK